MSTEEQVNETANYEVSVSDAAVAPDAQQEQEQPEAPAASAPEDAATDTAANTGEEAPPVKAGRFQKRIDRLTKRAAEAERRAEEAERRLNEKADAKPADKATTAEPDPSSFDDYDDYLEALSAWEDKGDKPEPPAQRDEVKDAPKDEAVSQEFTEALEDVNEAFAETRKQHSDFDEVIAQPDLLITQEMVIAMAEADDPGAIAYHLGKNKAEATRIATLSPIAQAREIGKLEAKLSVTPAAPSKKTTNAPDPIAPVKGSDSTQKALTDMDFNEYEQAANAREQKGGRGFW